MKAALEKFVYAKGEQVHVQIFRYVIVGGLAFTLDFLVLALLVEYYGFHYLPAAAFSFCLGLIVTYTLNRSWVFAHRKYQWGKEFGIFAVIGLAALGLTELAIWFFTEKILLHYLVSKIIAVVLVFALSFYLRRLLLFSAQKED